MPSQRLPKHKIMFVNFTIFKVHTGIKHHDDNQKLVRKKLTQFCHNNKSSYLFKAQKDGITKSAVSMDKHKLNEVNV